MSELRNLVEHELLTRCPEESARLISIVAEISAELPGPMQIPGTSTYWNESRLGAFVSLTALLRRALGSFKATELNQTIALRILVDAEKSARDMVLHMVPEGSA